MVVFLPTKRLSTHHCSAGDDGAGDDGGSLPPFDVVAGRLLDLKVVKHQMETWDGFGCRCWPTCRCCEG